MGSFIGTWMITEMEVWDDEYLHALGEPIITFDAEGSGQLQFGYIWGELDCRWTVRDGIPAVEFSWSGQDDGHDLGGRGWAVLIRETVIEGRFFIHLGDDSSFTAERLTHG